jgi:ATP-binding cassette subfamily B (MDR/TAP) protein 1
VDTKAGSAANPGDIELGVVATATAVPPVAATKGKKSIYAEVATTDADADILATELEVEEKTGSVGWVWELSGPERPYLYTGLFGAVLVGAAFPLLGYLLSAMISVFFNPDPQDMRNKAALYAYAFLGIGASQLIGAYLSQYCFGVITERLARRVREKSFLKMLSMAVAWYDEPNNTAGSLAQQLATDCMMVKALTGERASTSASQIVTFTVAFAIAFYQCWQMTLVMIGLFPLIGAAFAVQHAFVSQAAGAAMEATNEAGQVASQALLNVRTVNAFGLERMVLGQVSILAIPFLINHTALLHISHPLSAVPSPT